MHTQKPHPHIAPAGPWGPAAHFSDSERAMAALVADGLWAAACTLLCITAAWSLLPA